MLQKSGIHSPVELCSKNPINLPTGFLHIPVPVAPPLPTSPRRPALAQGSAARLPHLYSTESPILYVASCHGWQPRRPAPKHYGSPNTPQQKAAWLEDEVPGWGKTLFFCRGYVDLRDDTSIVPTLLCRSN